MFTMVPARSVLDHVWILSLDLAGLSLLQSCCNPLTLMFALFVECLLRTLNCHVYEQCLAEPLQCRNGVRQPSCKIWLLTRCRLLEPMQETQHVLVQGFWKVPKFYTCVKLYILKPLSNFGVFDVFSDVCALVLTCPLGLKCSWYLCSQDDTHKSSRIL